jgi:hypothetical protein
MRTAELGVLAKQKMAKGDSYQLKAKKAFMVDHG